MLPSSIRAVARCSTAVRSVNALPPRRFATTVVSNTGGVVVPTDGSLVATAKSPAIERVTVIEPKQLAPPPPPPPSYYSSPPPPPRKRTGFPRIQGFIFGVLTASAVWAYMIRDELFLFVSEVRDEMLPVNSALHAHITQLEKRIEQIDKQKK